MLPIIFESSFFTLFSYPLFIGLAWGTGYQYSLKLLLTYGGDLKGFRGFFWGNFLFAWLGAKVFFLIHSSGGEFTSYIGNSNFWLGGGFVFYGGLIFGIIFSLIYSHGFKKFKVSNIPLVLPALGMAHSIGRLGCFLAGCCYGKVCTLPWAVHFHGEDRHPVQLYESLSLFVLSLLTLQLVKQRRPNYLIIHFYLISYSCLRFALEFYRGDKIRGEYGTFSTSQWISLIGIGLMLGTFYRFRTKWSLPPT